MRVSVHSMFYFEIGSESKKQNTLSTFRRSIFDIFSVLKHSMTFLARFQLKCKFSKHYKNSIQILLNSERINSISYIVYEISGENFGSS